LELRTDDTLVHWDAIAAPVATEGDPDSFKPWLVSQLGLQLLPAYFDDIDTLLTEGRAWLLERGSPAAVRRVLGWLGYVQGVRLEEEGPYLHIDLGRVASAQELQHVALLVRDSIPLHVEFYRVYHGWDRRAVRLDGGQRLDQALLDTDSGVWVQTSTGELRASFAQRRQTYLAAQRLANPWGHAVHEFGRVVPMRHLRGQVWGATPWPTDTTWHHTLDHQADALQGTTLGAAAQTPQPTTTTTGQALLARGTSAVLAHTVQTTTPQVPERLLRSDAWWPAPWPDQAWALAIDTRATTIN
jgi:hypothetical protein